MNLIVHCTFGSHLRTRFPSRNARGGERERELWGLGGDEAGDTQGDEEGDQQGQAGNY